MRALLDTNVVLDFLLARGSFFAEADAIFVFMQDDRFDAFVSAITPINAFYTLRKAVNGERATELVKNFVRLVSIAQTDESVISKAFELDFSDYEDAVQCASAIAEGLDAIVTRNTKDFENSPITVYSPGEFLKVIEASGR